MRDVDDQVLALLRESPLVDGHNDLPWVLWKRAERDLDRLDVARSQPTLHTDLERLRTGGVGGQFWSVFVECALSGPDAVSAVLEQVFLVRRMCERYPEHLRLATTADEARKAFADGRIASLLGAEGGHCIDNSLSVLRTLRLLGVRYLTLTHAKNVGWADASTDERVVGGLSEFGREVVRTMNEIGMLVDLSHVATETMHAALDVTTVPVLFTHSSCRALTDNPRNVPDDVLLRLRDNGGVCMITFVPQFVAQDVSDWYAEAASRGKEWAAAHPQPAATLSQVADHVEYARAVMGVEHVGIGGDFDGVGVMPQGLDDVSCYPALLTELARRGWSSAELRAVAGGNVLRVLSDADQC
ncbi:dipeptidase [Kribbella sancticallisti]|uniref:Dipeptidase n=1 Tax=Kribbella sancticallisti TaxID=460087 RepID=A0ABN2DK56_9ACTN